MVKKAFVIITIDNEDFDYYTLKEYLKHNIFVNSLYVIPHGFFIELVYEKNKEYNSIIDYARNLHVKDIESHSVLYESFLSKHFME